MQIKDKKKIYNGANIHELTLSYNESKLLFDNFLKDPTSLTIDEILYQYDYISTIKSKDTFKESVIGAKVLRALKEFVEFSEKGNKNVTKSTRKKATITKKPSKRSKTK